MLRKAWAWDLRESDPSARVVTRVGGGGIGVSVVGGSLESSYCSQWFSIESEGVAGISGGQSGANLKILAMIIRGTLSWS